MPGRALLKSPIVWSGLLAIILVAVDFQFPLTLSNTLNLLGGMAIPLMLLTLGVSLVGLKLKDVATAVSLGCARIVVSVAAGVLTVALLDLEGVLRGVILLQAATPAAVFNYLLAQQYRRSPEAVAGLVMASTLISFATIPLCWLFWFNRASASRACPVFRRQSARHRCRPCGHPRRRQLRSAGKSW